MFDEEFASVRTPSLTKTASEKISLQRVCWVLLKNLNLVAFNSRETKYQQTLTSIWNAVSRKETKSKGRMSFEFDKRN